MNSQDFRNLQEAYLDVYYELDEAGATSARLADVVRQRMDGRRDFSVLPQGVASLGVLMNLEKNAKQRANDRYPEQSSARRGEGGSGVPSRSLDPVRISPKERGRITDKEIIRRYEEQDANRNVPLTRREVPIPVRSRPTPPNNSPTSRTNTPLTPRIRDQRAAEAGFSGPGSSPKGSKLSRQTQRGVTTGDNPFAVLSSASTEPKPLPKPKGKGNSTPKKSINASYDLYDIILSHLLDEGYADTPEQAEVIMVNMSEDWRESICEGLKPLPVSKMSKQARRIAFSHGTDVNSDEGSSGNVPHSNAARALAKMARFGGKEVKSHIKKGYERGSRYDPYYQELNSRNPSRNKEV